MTLLFLNGRSTLNCGNSDGRCGAAEDTNVQIRPFGTVLLRINFLQVPRRVRKKKRQLRPPKLESGGDAKGRELQLRVCVCVCTYSALARARGVADRKHARASLSLMWRPKLYDGREILERSRSSKISE